LSSAVHGWSNPPLDYAPDPPARATYYGAHPIKRGLGAFLTVVAVTVFSLVILAVAVGTALFFAISWCFDAGNYPD
jgi:hypothetical protein